ncbi:MAG TPA: HAD hydrolase-like protein [Terriglobia bacterium]|nr:HAD hydrolase-like protein [Terriglobia bacterium]
MIDSVRRVVQSARAVIFDFDGTLVDSNEIKRRGFDYAFADYPEFMDEIRTYCYGFNHTNRYEKFRYVTEKILRLNFTPAMEKRFTQRYAEFTTASVADAPEIPGAEAFLRSLGPRRPALLSSTPTEILLEILERRGWRALFSIVQGAPVDKRSWLKQFQDSLGCRSNELVFMGDTDEDAQSAREAGVLFIRVGPPSDAEGLAIQDFRGL